MKKRILELDALRGIAACIVMLFHINLFFPLFHSTLANGIYKYGASGVDLFFMISGFVIAWTLEKTLTWKDFAVSRFARLYPTYWTCVSLTAFFTLIYFINIKQPHQYISSGYLVNLTMFQHFFSVKDIDDVYWTLLVEMLFYIYMFIIFTTKNLKYVQYISMALMLPLFFYSSCYFRQNYTGVHLLLQQYLPIVNYFPLFVMGIIYYKMKFERPTILGFAAILFCLACQLKLYGNGQKSVPFLNLKNYIEITLGYNLVFTLFVFNKLKFVVNKVTLFLGQISYPLYLIHYSLSVFVIIPLLIRLGCGVPVAVIINLAIVIGFASTISALIERPANRYIRKKLLSPKAAEPVPGDVVPTIIAP
jgi:peptidoglycan/LPS O-acetylase OafA/YrhL